MFEEAYPILEEMARLLAGAWETMRAWDGVTLLLLGVVIGFFIAIGLGSIRGATQLESNHDSQTMEREEHGGSMAEFSEACA